LFEFCKHSKTVAAYTLGCKVNQYETEAMLDIFEKEGYEVVDFDQSADVYLINTCTVTNLSDRKSRQAIRKAKNKNKNSIVVVAGCYAQTSPGEVSQIPGVNLIIGTKDRKNIISYIKDIETGKNQITAVHNIMRVHDFEELEIDEYKGHTRAFLKIQEGCSQFCTYCIIPYARGPIRSRHPGDVLAEVKRLAEHGFKEVVLTGIHIASYGRDLGNTTLLEIIKEMNKIDGIERIRLGSIEPHTITEEFVQAAKEMKKLCPHYHISLQSGCNETLKRMNRRYTVDEYMGVVRLLRKNIEDVALTTDVMTGFPGETDEEFEKTCEFLEEVEFMKMHVFKYSPRKGTPAAEYENQVAPEKKEERSKRLIEMSQRFSLEFNKKHVGRKMPVLFEQEVKEKDGYIQGLTSNYIEVLCKGNASLKGKIVNTYLTEALAESIIGIAEE
jgi:threonylcarbamoyladenosine tRNA methylthiotransferase MtaB